MKRSGRPFFFFSPPWAKLDRTLPFFHLCDGFSPQKEGSPMSTPSQRHVLLLTQTLIVAAAAAALALASLNEFGRQVEVVPDEALVRVLDETRPTESALASSTDGQEAEEAASDDTTLGG